MGKNEVFAITRKNGVLMNCVNSIMLIDHRKPCFLVILFELFLSIYPFSVSHSESVSYKKSKKSLPIHYFVSS